MRYIELINIFKSDNPQINSNIYALTNVTDTGANTNNLYETNKVFNLNSLTEELSKPNNDIFDSEGLLSLIKSMMDSPIFEIPHNSLEKILSSTKEITLSDVLMNLSIMKSKFQYNPDFYRDVLGGYSFSDFNPNFDTANMGADKLIVSNTKLNIVLVATMSGLVDINSFTQPMLRFVPFKLVKQGQIMADSLTVILDDKNRDYLSSLPHVTISGETATIHCKEFKPFNSSDFTIRSVAGIINNITSLKSVIRAYNYASEGLKKQISREELYENEWYRGQAVDDGYVSDEGTDKLEMWIKGRKNIPNLNEIFKSTAHLSVINHIKMFVDSSIDIYNFTVDDEFKATVQALNNSLYGLLKQGEINDIVYHAMSTLLQTSLTDGTPLERYEAIKKKKSHISNMLNLLELKLLPVRKKVMDTCDGMDVTDNLYLHKLGSVNGGTSDSIGIYNPDANCTIMFRMTKIVKREKQDDSLTESKINTDPRSEI